MKKIFFLGILFFNSWYLIGCTASNTEYSNSNNKKEVSHQESKERKLKESSSLAIDTTEKQSDPTKNTYEDAKDTGDPSLKVASDNSSINRYINPSELSDYEEYNYLKQGVPNFEKLKVKILLNNKYKRILLLVNNEKKYKSIFLKNKKCLKVIDETIDNEILNTHI